MSLLYLPESANHILTASSFSTSSSEDSNLPWTNLKNPQVPFAGRFNVAAADDFIHADLGSSKAATLCAVIFDNLDDAITVELRRGASGTTLVSTMTKDTPAFYSTFGSASDQHWRLKFVGTNSSKIYQGKWVLGTPTTVTRNQKKGWGVRYLMDQNRVDSALSPKNMTKFARRLLNLDFQAVTVAQRDELLQMQRDGEWGAVRVLVVPDDNNPLVLYGKVAGEWSYTNDAGGVFPNAVTVEDDSFPVIVT